MLKLSIQRETVIPEHQLSTHALRRFFKEMNYGFKLYCRKRILLKEDLDKSFIFVEKLKIRPPAFRKERISFLLDGVAFGLMLIQTSINKL